MNRINYVTAAVICGNEIVIFYCLGFHIFRLFHAMNCICCILPNFIFQFNAVKLSLHEQ